MIKSITIDNFKSLVDFNIEFENFSCLIGLNGSGKSTVLQAVDFISQLMHGDIDAWLKQRQWKAADINSKLSPKSNIEFSIGFEGKNGEPIVWSGSVNRRTLRCTSEGVEAFGHTLLDVDDGKCAVMSDRPPNSLNATIGEGETDRFPIVFEYQGSILSQLKESQLHPALRELKAGIANLQSLDLLSPELLRTKSRVADGSLGVGGHQLSAFLHESGGAARENLVKLLQKIYPQLQTLETKSLRSGWKEIEIAEKFDSVVLKSQARHINDGLLRMLAILAQLEKGKQFLLFDEIENGINPELIEYLVDHLVNAHHQVLITTHSPMILNYLEDDTAKKGIIYLYKNEKGHTQAIKLFDIPSMAKKLDFMGPGEVFVDTNLPELINEITMLEHL